MKRCAVFVLLLSQFIAAHATTSQHEVFSTFINTDQSKLAVAGVDPLTATLVNNKAGALLITKTITGTSPLPPIDKNDHDAYCIIHLLRWSKSSTTEKPSVGAQNWYLYHSSEKGWSAEDFTTNKRLYGNHHVYFLFVHFNADKTAYTPTYSFVITKKTPANVAHLYSLLSSFAAGSDTSTGAARKPDILGDTNWGGGHIDLEYVPSDIKISSTFITTGSETSQKLADDITFDNEGRYYWDVGFAIPAKKISDIKLDSTSGTATPAKVNGINTFAIIDGYLKAMDIKGSGFAALPHPIVGVAFAKQPLSRILVGGAWGPHVSELYLSAIFVKQPELSGSTSCSNPSGTTLTAKKHYCAQFSIGINLSVSAIASKIGAPK